MAALQKTWSGDFTTWVAGQILDAINNYDEEEKLKEASPKVKQAARELRKEDPDVQKVQSTNTAIVVKESIIPVHVKVEDTNKEVKKLSGKVAAIGTGLADTSKLIGDQNAMLEAKFDIMLTLLQARNPGEEGVGGAIVKSGGLSGTGGIVPVTPSKLQRIIGGYGKAFAGPILRRTLKFIRRRIIPRRLRAGGRLLRMRAKRVLSPLKNLRPRKLASKAVSKFATSGIGKKLTAKLGVKTATKIGGKAVGKSLAKKVPILGALAGTAFAIQRLNQKPPDYLGASMEFASGIASIFPGVGTGISVGLDAALVAKDVGDAMNPPKSSTSIVPKRESTISNFEKGSGGPDIMGMFKQASSLLISSMIPVAAAAGTLPEVKNQIKSAGLDGVEIARMQPPTGLTIGRGGKKVSLPAPPEPTVAKIPGLPKLPGHKPSGDDRNIFQKGFDSTKDFLGGAWNWVSEGFTKSVKLIADTVSAGYNFVDEKADVIRDIDVGGFGVGGERDDGKITLMRTPWGNVEFGNPFNRKKDKNVTSETAVVPNGKESETSTSGGDYDQISGAKAIMNIDSNITPMGAAYLSGNIQQESSWNGMRSWGQELGDGTSRNGGLVSWASWEDDPARLGKIEEHYGKKIDEITEHEQLKWMIKELKQSYPGAYKIFTSEKSTIADLKKASKWYWGYGHEGERFNYADSIYKQLQNAQPDAEKGALLPSTDVSMKSHQVQESSAIVDEIEDYEVPQPIVYLTNSEISVDPLIMVKSKSRTQDFVEQYRFMSLGAA